MSITSGTAEINGVNLYYEDAGTGPPLVLLHDGLLDCRIWDDQFKVLSGNYRVVRYDMRGHGRSGISADEFSHIEDLRDLLGFLNIERAHLLGLSNGGRVALDFSLAYPKMVGTLVLVGPSLSGYHFSEETRRRISESFSAGNRNGATAFADSWLEDYFWAPSLGGAATRRKLRELLLEAFHYFSRPPRPSELQEPGAIRRLSEVPCPVVVVVGERDSPDNRAIADILESSIPGAEKVTMPDVGHMLNLEMPEEFNRLALDLLCNRRHSTLRRSHRWGGGAASGDDPRLGRAPGAESLRRGG